MTQYSTIAPIKTPIAADRQGAKRHYGVHPYFTRRPYNVVRDYILHYSSEQNVVVDPFGGSGITALEAFFEKRGCIQNHINSPANFIPPSHSNLHPGDTRTYTTPLPWLK